MPAKPHLLGTTDEARVRDARAKGWSVDKIASQLDIKRHLVQTLVAYIDKEAPKVGLDTPPEVPDSATPRERAELHTRWLKAQVDKLVKDKAPPRDVAAISTQYANAMKLEARLSGALEVTASQVVRSTDFQRALQALRRACGDDLGVWERFNAELRVLLGEEEVKT